MPEYGPTDPWLCTAGACAPERRGLGLALHCSCARPFVDKAVTWIIKHQSRSGALRALRRRRKYEA